MTGDGSVPVATEHRELSDDCFRATYRVALTHLDLDPTLLGSDWGYQRVASSSADVWPLRRLRASRRTDEKLLREWYGLEEERIDHPNPDAAIDTIRRRTDAGSVVIVTCDNGALPYSPVRGQLHFPHRVAIMSVDGDEATVVDDYKRSPFRGALPLEVLREALGFRSTDARLWGLEPGVATTIELRRGSAPDGEVGERIAARLDENVAVHRTPTADGGRLAFAGAVEELRASDATALYDDGLRTWTLNLLGIVASQRAANATFLRAAARTLGRDRLADAARVATESAESWTVGLLTTAARARRDPAGTRDRLAARLATIGEVEDRLVVAVDDALR